MTTKKTTLTIYEALNVIQVNLNAKKGQKNNFGKYSYRSAEDILESVKPLLKNTGAILTLTDKVEIIGERYYVTSTASFGKGKDVISVSASARECESKKGMDAAQLTGSCSSYARKYALNGLFAIDDGKVKPPIEIDSTEFSKLGEGKVPSGDPIGKSASPSKAKPKPASSDGLLLIPCGAMKGTAYQEAIKDSNVCQQHIDHWTKNAKTEDELKHLSALKSFKGTFAKGVA